MEAGLRAISLALLATFSLLFMPASRAQEAGCSISVRWNDDPPYSIRAADNSIGGINADLAKEALQRLDCQIRFVEMPWARGILSLKKGTLDILPGALRTHEREAFAHFSQPTNNSPNVLFMHRSAAGKYHFQQLSDLIDSDFRLGAQIDVNYGADYQALLQNPAFKSHLVLINSRRGAWKMIQAGRLDGLIADEITGLLELELELEQMSLSDEIQRSDLIISGELAAFALSKQSLPPDFAQKFDQSISSMKADGTYQRIMETYLPCRVSVANLGCE